MGTYTSDQESNSVLTNGNSHNDASFIHNKENGKDDGEYYDGSSPSGQSPQYDTHGTSSDSVKEVFSIDRIDPVLQRKMALVNESIDSIRMTAYQWEMFVLNGFGYAVDSVHDPSYSLHQFQSPDKYCCNLASRRRSFDCEPCCPARIRQPKQARVRYRTSLSSRPSCRRRHLGLSGYHRKKACIQHQPFVMRNFRAYRWGDA